MLNSLGSHPTSQHQAAWDGQIQQRWRRSAHLEKVIEQVWVLFQVEADGLVVHLHTADLDSHILEQDMLPGHRAVVHHHHGCIVVLVILYVQEDQLLPVVELLTHTDEARDVDARAEQLQVFHQLFDLVPAAEIRPTRCVCLQAQATTKGMQAPSCVLDKDFLQLPERTCIADV